VGYTPLRSQVTVQAGDTEISYVLHPAPQVLSTIRVEARQVVIHGTVADSVLKPIAGVKVQLAGRGGGETTTDNDGRFSFPAVREGPYMVRAAAAGYTEKRVFVELDNQKGVELAIRLRSSRQIESRAEVTAIHDLGRRLVANLPSDRLAESQLERYGTLSLCDIPGIASKVKSPTYGLTIILNGTNIMENMSTHDLCSWQASEVELVEFGSTVCRDVTRSLVDMLSVWCTRFNEPRARSTNDRRMVLDGGNSSRRIKTQKTGGPFVVIWERR
jgi:hypothetical protein